MKRIIFSILVFLLSLINMSGQTRANYERTSITFMGTELDGSYTLRVLGYGRNRADAKEQAMKNAVSAILFNGINANGQGQMVRPLVTEVNARERYEDYFNIFFADNGEYKKYVSLKDTKRWSADKSKNKVGYSYEMTIRVLRSELKDRLKKDNVISNDHL